MPVPYILIGNPENRRVLLFQEALVEQGLPPATVIAWKSLLESMEPLERIPNRSAVVRIDAAGENSEVERGLLRLGYESALSCGVSVVDPLTIADLPYDRGRILCPRQAHLGFLALLVRLERTFATKVGWRVLSHPRAIADLFDKRLTAQLYAASSVPVPPNLSGIVDPAALRAAMHERGWSSVFIKLSCGSSASCLAVYHFKRDSESLMTTIERSSTGWYNTLRIQRLTRRKDIDELIGFLIREGSQIERTIAKARLDKAFFDCRVLVIAGQPVFIVVRQNRHPITNLHLGGWRGNQLALAERIPVDVMEAAMTSCRRIAALHRVFQIGIDVLFEARMRGHYVLEGNAFGDLLPNLKRDGLSVYAWQIRQAARLFASSARPDSELE